MGTVTPNTRVLMVALIMALVLVLVVTVAADVMVA